MIPKDTNILITHGPANNILDKLENEVDHVGCEDLEYKVKYELSNLKLHTVGHIHHSYGTYSNNYGTAYVNASICTESYDPTNAPIVVDIH
jgi:Icc-related predicted phosphoesterase